MRIGLPTESKSNSGNEVISLFVQSRADPRVDLKVIIDEVRHAAVYTVRCVGVFGVWVKTKVFEVGTDPVSDGVSKR